MMGVPMKDDGGAKAVAHVAEARAAEKREDLARLAGGGFGDGGIVHAHHPPLLAQLRERALQREALLHRTMHKRLDLGLAEGGELAPAKPAAETFDAGEADTVALVGLAVQSLDADLAQHAQQLG